jgi:hypothetical protein
MKRDLLIAILSSKTIQLFREIYEGETGEKIYLNGKHKGIARNLIKNFGEQLVLEKARRLFLVCKEGKEFYARKGFADFTLENLSVHWNRLVGIKSKEVRFKESLEERRVADERIAKILDRG